MEPYWRPPSALIVTASRSVTDVVPEACEVLADQAEDRSVRMAIHFPGVVWCDGHLEPDVPWAAQWPERLRGVASNGLLLCTPSERPADVLNRAWGGSWAGWEFGEVPATWSVLTVDDLMNGHPDRCDVRSVFGADRLPATRAGRQRPPQHGWPLNMIELLVDPARQFKLGPPSLSVPSALQDAPTVAALYSSQAAAGGRFGSSFKKLLRARATPTR